MYVWMDGWIITVDSLPIRGPDPGTPPPTGEGTMLPTRMHLTPPGCTANRAPQAVSSLVCTNPACSTNQQARGKQGAISYPPPPRRAAYKRRHQNMWRFHTPKSTSK